MIMTIELANKLTELRKKHNLSQEELADKLNVSRQAISKWERAEASPDTDNLIELAKLYEVSLDELVGLKGKEEKVEVVDKKPCPKPQAVRPTKWDILVSTFTTVAVVVTYVLLGAFAGLWDKAWPIFFLIVVIPSLFETIERRNPSHFAYPVFIVGLYLFLCVNFFPDLWHPLWLMLLTIPVYYTLAKVLKRK